MKYDTLKDQMLSAYINYVNNFITVDGFAQYYGISYEMASLLIKEMREYNESLSEIDKAKILRENPPV